MINQSFNVVFGPDGRNYAFKAPKKVRKLALKMALSTKLGTSELVVLDEFELKQIKTKDFVGILKSLKLTNTLIVADAKNQNLELSSRNVPNVKVLRAEGLNVYDILKFTNLLFTRDAVESVQEVLQK